MKLKNKLLPLVGVGAVCATVTPLAMLTSCGNNGNLIDLTTRYEPSFDKLKSSEGPFYWNDVEGPEKSATNVWTDFMIENPDCFSEEYYWSVSTAVRTTNNRSMNGNYEKVKEWAEKEPEILNPDVVAGKPEKAESSTNAAELFSYTSFFDVDEEKISNVKIEKTKVSYDPDGASTGQEAYTEQVIPVISFDLEYERTLNTKARNADFVNVSAYQASLNQTTTLHGVEKYYRIPFVVYPMDYETISGAIIQVWKLLPLFEWMAHDTLGVQGVYTPESAAAGTIIGTSDKILWNIDVELQSSTTGEFTQSGMTQKISNKHKTNFSLNWDNYKAILAENPDALETLQIKFSEGLYTSWYLYSIGIKE